MRASLTPCAVTFGAATNHNDGTPARTPICNMRRLVLTLLATIGVLVAVVVVAVVAIAIGVFGFAPWESAASGGERVDACEFFTPADAAAVLGEGAEIVGDASYRMHPSDCIYLASSYIFVSAWKGDRSDFKFLTDPDSYAAKLDNPDDVEATIVGGADGWLTANVPDDCRLLTHENGYAFIVQHGIGPFDCFDRVTKAAARVVRNARSAASP